MNRRILQAVVLLAVLMLPVVAFAADPYPKSWSYEVIGENEIAITEFRYIDKDGATLNIPSKLFGYKVTAIYDLGDWFHGSKITLPNTVTVIKGNPFRSLSNLQSIGVNGNHPTLKTVDGVLFDKKGETLIAYPQRKKDKAYQVPKGVVTVGERAFNYAYYLENLQLSDTTRVIEDSAFGNCVNLHSVQVHEGLESIGDYAFSQCLKLEAFTMPDSVCSIGEGSFYMCKTMRNVGLSQSLQVIPEMAFFWNGELTSVSIPEGVDTIEKGAFKDCNSMTSVTLPSSLRTIGEDAFNGCVEMKEVPLPEGVLSIQKNAFAHCDKIESLKVPKSVQQITDMGLSYRCKIQVYKGSYAEEVLGKKYSVEIIED